MPKQVTCLHPDQPSHTDLSRKCRYFASGKCQKGSKCKFSHDDKPAKSNQPGGRHNNDFTDICDVQIMPTFEEIVSSKS